MKIGNDDVKKVYIGESVVSKVYSSYYDEDVRSTILKSMVCWYDPHRQGCTNVNMAANPVLKDFSGNKRDMTCHNFDWTTTSGIAEDGSLRFDGVNDYCSASNPILTDFTAICRRKHEDLDGNPAFRTLAGKLSESNSASSGDGSFILDFFDVSNKLLYAGSFGNIVNTGVSVDSLFHTVYLTKTNYNGIKKISSGEKPDIETLYLGKFNITDVRKFKGCMDCFMLFNRTLTDEEITWVKANLIENRYRYLVCPIVGVADPNVDLDGIRDENGFLWIEAD